MKETRIYSDAFTVNDMMNDELTINAIIENCPLSTKFLRSKYCYIDYNYDLDHLDDGYCIILYNIYRLS